MFAAQRNVTMEQDAPELTDHSFRPDLTSYRIEVTMLTCIAQNIFKEARDCLQ